MVTFLRGRGHRVTTAPEAELDDGSDAQLIEYALSLGMVVLTLDRDFRSTTLRRGCPCLFIRTPELTARDRLRAHYHEVIGLLLLRHRLVTLPPDGPPFVDSGRPPSRPQPPPNRSRRRR